MGTMAGTTGTDAGNPVSPGIDRAIDRTIDRTIASRSIASRTATRIAAGIAGWIAAGLFVLCVAAVSLSLPMAARAADVEQACKEFAVFVADREIGTGARGTTPYKQLRNAVYKECLARGGPPEQEPDDSSDSADSNEAPLTEGASTDGGSTDGGSTDGATGETQDGEGGKPGGPADEPEPGRGPGDPGAMAQLCYRYGEAFALGRGMLPGGAAWDAIVGYAQGSCIGRNGPTSPINHYDPCDYAGDLCGYGDTPPPTGTGGDSGTGGTGAPTTMAARCLAFAGAYLGYNAAGFQLPAGSPIWNERLGEIAEHCRDAGGPELLNLYTNEQTFCCNEGNTQTPRTVLLNQCFFYGQGFADWFSGVPRGEPGHAPVQEWGRMLCLLLDGAENAPYGIDRQPYCCRGVSGTNPQMVITRCQAYSSSMAQTLVAYPGLASHFPGGTTSQQVYDVCRERNGPAGMPFGSFSGGSPWIDQAALDAAIAALPPPGDTSADCESYGATFAALKGLAPGQPQYARTVEDAGFACAVMGEAIAAPIVTDECNLYMGGCGYGDPYKAIRDEALEAVSGCWLYGAWHAERLEPRGSREWAEALAGKFWHCAGAGGASGSFETGYPDTLPPRSLQPAVATFLAGYIEKGGGEDNQEAPPPVCPHDPRCTVEVILAWCADNPGADECITVIDNLPPPPPIPPLSVCPAGTIRIGDVCYSPSELPDNPTEPSEPTDSGCEGGPISNPLTAGNDGAADNGNKATAGTTQNAGDPCLPDITVVDSYAIAVTCYAEMIRAIGRDGGVITSAHVRAMERCFEDKCAARINQYLPQSGWTSEQANMAYRRCVEEARSSIPVTIGAPVRPDTAEERLREELDGWGLANIYLPEIDNRVVGVFLIGVVVIGAAAAIVFASPAVAAAAVVVAAVGIAAGAGGSGGGGAIIDNGPATQSLVAGTISSSTGVWAGPSIETICGRISERSMAQNPELGELLELLQPVFRDTHPNLRRTMRDFIRDICVLNAPSEEAAAGQAQALAASCANAGWHLPGGPPGLADGASLDVARGDTADAGSGFAAPANIDLPDDPDYADWLNGVASFANNCLRTESYAIESANPYLYSYEGEHLANAWTAMARSCALDGGYAWPEGLGAPEWPSPVDSANQARAIAERFRGCLEALGPEN
jgi:hypothetical protein